MPCVDSLTFANNKGGSGKTFLGFQFACEAARANPKRKVLVVDLSLYSEISGILMGGLKREHALAPSAGRMRTVRVHSSPGGCFPRRRCLQDDRLRVLPARVSSRLRALHALRRAPAG